MDKFDKKMLTGWFLFNFTLIAILITFKLLDNSSCQAYRLQQQAILVPQKPLELKIKLEMPEKVEKKTSFIKWEAGK